MMYVQGQGHWYDTLTSRKWEKHIKLPVHSLLYPLLCLATLTVTTTNKEESNKENNKAKDSKSRIIHQNNNNNNNNNVTTRTKGSNFYKLAVNTKINRWYQYRFCMWMLTERKNLNFLSTFLYFLSNKLVKRYSGLMLNRFWGKQQI